MADTSPARPLRSLLVVCACILALLVVAALALARVVLIPLALAVLLTFILTPLVLLSALVMAQRDHERGVLAPAEQQNLLRDMRQILEEIVPFRCPGSPTTPRPPGTPAEDAGRSRPIVFSVPASSEADELALSMLKQLLDTAGCQFEVLPAGIPAAEVVSRVAKEQPAGVVIAVLPPASLADTRYLCKRLRAQLPDVKILVGRWGQKENTDQTRERLRGAGADAVGTTLLESRVQILPLLEENRYTPPAAKGRRGRRRGAGAKK